MSSLRLYSWNVNGVRSVARKGFLDWFRDRAPHVLCLQETKAHPEQLEEGLREIAGYRAYWAISEKAGYSGVVTYTRVPPSEVHFGLGDPQFDREGRVVTTRFQDFVLVNAYFPNAQREHTRLPYKLDFCAAIQAWCQGFRDQGLPVVICGDFNVAHEAIDLANPKSNQNHSGFLPEERAWMSQFLASDFCDIFRDRNPGPGHYTWWSYRPGVRERNIGWRIDYHLVSSDLKSRVSDVGHEPMTMGSDHCPVWLELESRSGATELK